MEVDSVTIVSAELSKCLTISDNLTPGTRRCGTSHPLSSLFIATTLRDHFWLVYTYQLNPPMCHFNLGNLMDVQSSLLWRMAVGVGEVCSLTSEALVNLNKGCLILPHGSDRRRPLLPNLTHPEYPITPEAAQRS
ncbi:hypothetical protein J6590_092943 [Homalodisca vitripennis]|nr:hypothetical protein J6590_092943 [Homalodisca vitripennis]